MLAPLLLSMACMRDASLGRELSAGGEPGNGGATQPDAGAKHYNPEEFIFNEFDSRCSGLIVSGSAKCAGGELVLDPGPDNRGGAFLPCSVDFGPNTSFEFALTFTMSDIADGMAVVIHADPRGPGTIATAGSGLGYSGLKLGYAVNFDSFSWSDSLGERLEVVTTEDQTSLGRTLLKLSLADGTPNYGWVSYNGLTNELSASVSKTPDRPATDMLIATVDLSALSTSGVYVGLTASYGAIQGLHSVSRWVGSFSKLATLMTCPG